jgi:hypothetical protein
MAWISEHVDVARDYDVSCVCMVRISGSEIQRWDVIRICGRWASNPR